MTHPEKGTDDQGSSWLSPAEVASLAGVSARTVSSACSSGALPHRRAPYRGGFRYEISAADAEAWARSRGSSLPRDETPLVFELALERGRVQELERQLAEERLATAEAHHRLQLRLLDAEHEAASATAETARLRAALVALVGSPLPPHG